MSAEPESVRPAEVTATSYLTAPDATTYLAIMTILIQASEELRPDDIATRLTASGTSVDSAELGRRLDSLRAWGVVDVRTDSSEIRRYADVLARNWRYHPTPTGRRVQRFHQQLVTGGVLPELPLTTLSNAVAAAEELAAGPDDRPMATTVGLVVQLFASHGELDRSLVGAEDTLSALADPGVDHESVPTRRSEDQVVSSEDQAARTRLVIDYATRLAVDLDHGCARLHRALAVIDVEALSELVVAASPARPLLEAGLLAPQAGGRPADWESLKGWTDPEQGRGREFGRRVLRSLPPLHARLRRHRGQQDRPFSAADLRTRALAFARAALDPAYGAEIVQAALGDHPWRKFVGEATEEDVESAPSWWDGPTVGVPELLRRSGRGGARGRLGRHRDDRASRSEVDDRRRQRTRDHAEAVREVLAEPGRDQPRTDQPGHDQLGETAARAALAVLLRAARVPDRAGRRTAVVDGLACTIVHVGQGSWQLSAPTWRVELPRRIALFHRPGERPSDAALAPYAELTVLPDPTDEVLLSGPVPRRAAESNGGGGR